MCIVIYVYYNIYNHHIHILVYNDIQCYVCISLSLSLSPCHQPNTCISGCQAEVAEDVWINLHSHWLENNCWLQSTCFFDATDHHPSRWVVAKTGMQFLVFAHSNPTTFVRWTPTLVTTDSRQKLVSQIMFNPRFASHATIECQSPCQKKVVTGNRTWQRKILENPHIYIYIFVELFKWRFSSLGESSIHGAFFSSPNLRKLANPLRDGRFFRTLTEGHQQDLLDINGA